MCGIFGLILSDATKYSYTTAKKTLENLFRLSESRGREASGVAMLSGDTIYVCKYNMAASKMIAQNKYQSTLKKVFSEHINREHGESIAILGHTRLVTNGSQQNYVNNQPVISEGLVGIHNGIITNVDDLWIKFPSLERKYQVDTEILLDLIRKFYQDNGCIRSGVMEAFSYIEGSASIGVLFTDINQVLLATNNGSLYICSGQKENVCIFASEKYILEKVIKKKYLSDTLRHSEISQVKPGSACLVNLADLSRYSFSMTDHQDNMLTKMDQVNMQRKIIEIKLTASTVITRTPGEGPYVLSRSFRDENPANQEKISNLRRCTRCVLPETMPFIEFDVDGVCNYCRNYNAEKPLGIDALHKIIEPYRKRHGEVDSLVTFSGGRDSSFGVHFVKNVLKMNPITYTYDWGMVTDLARRNQMRMCGKLGIEHILVSANIAKKRKNIRKNILAWLNSPSLGTIPLFMAGDKQYFYYANKVGKQNRCNIIILCENPLETTRFKVGFCGIEPDHGGRQTYKLAFYDRMKLLWFYSKQAINNHGYINASILDSIGAYLSYYFIPHTYLNIYEYIQWDEHEINSTLIGEYNWETAKDMKSTWRIGDGTASFYNYIYYTIAGFTENDTFRSNQIREGMISREEGLQLVDDENRPRYESIQWYCDIVDIDFERTIERINKVPKLYMDHH